MKNINKNSSKLSPKFKTIIKWSFYSIFSTYLFIWLFSPVIAQHFLTSFLNDEYGIVLAEESSIRFNPFTSHLTVRELSLHKKGQPVFRLNNLDLEIRLHRLILKELYFSEITLSNMFVLVEKTETIEIAGININHEPAVNRLTDNKDNVEIVDEKNETSEFEVVIPEVEFNAGRFELSMGSDNHVLEIKNIRVKDVKLSQLKQNISARMSANIDKANLNVNMKLSIVDMLGNIEADVSIDKYDLQNTSKLLPGSIKHINGQISLESKQFVSLQKEKIYLKSSETKISLNDFELTTDEIKLYQQQQDLLVSNFELELLNIEEESRVKTEKIKFNGFNAYTELADFKIDNTGQSVFINDLSLSSNSDELFNVNIEKMSVEVDAVKGVSEKFEFKSRGVILGLDEFHLSPKQLQLEAITLNGFNGLLRILKSNSVNAENNSKTNDLSAKVEPLSHEKIKVDEGEVSKSSELERTALEPAVAISKLYLKNMKEFIFIDESISPSYKREILLEEMSVEKIDSNKPLQESPFVFKGSSDLYTKIDFSGFVKPFTDKINLAINGKIVEVSLPPASSYVRKIMGFQFENGELDTSLDLTINDSEIKGETNIKIRGLGLETLDGYDQNSLQKQTALPLNVALDMLKDDNGNLELDIPMSGNIDNPSFGMASFVNLITKKAIQSAAKSYLLNTFVPYAKLVSVTISAGDFILKTRFEDLIYKPEQIDIDEQQIDYLNQFVALMTEKNTTSVKVCATSSLADLGLKIEELLAEKDRVDYLMDISNKRMIAFKEYAVSKNIESFRILLCNPKVDLSKEAENQPRIEISV